MPYKDPEKQKEYLRQYEERRKGLTRGHIVNLTPEQIEQRKEHDRQRKNAYQQRWQKQNGGQGYRSRNWESRLRRDFGITSEEFHALLKRQNNRCAACGAEFQGFSGSRSDRLAVDYCHDTNRVRGLLCGSCNRTIGHAKECSKRLRACADYLDAVPL